MRFYLAILALLSLATPALAQTDDAYAPARAIVADIGKIVTPNGVQETFELTLGGARQVVNVRGSDRDTPILIFVHGGPGSVQLPFAWALQPPWEDALPVRHYDTTGTGHGYAPKEPAASAPPRSQEHYTTTSDPPLQVP